MSPPRVSVLMLTWHHEAWIADAMASVLSQDWPALELLVFDDASDDGTWDEVQRVARAYAGPHELVLRRHPHNVGAVENTRQIIAAARGELHIVSDGDDLSAPGRVRRVAELWAQDRVSLISHDCTKGERPHPSNPRNVAEGQTGRVPVEEAAGRSWDPRMQGATFCLAADIWDQLPFFEGESFAMGGDMVVPFRASLLRGWTYLHEPLLFWRRHDRQATASMTDPAGTPDAVRETALPFHIAAMHQRRRDLDRLDSLRGPTNATLAARPFVDRQSLQLYRQWALSRAALEHEGQSLRWVGRGGGA